MKTPTQQLKKTIMWYKVKELNSEGLNKSQISVALDMDRGTVRKYLGMTETDFINWVNRSHGRCKKLQAYVTYIREQLEAHPYLSSAQIEDRLKEHFPDSPTVSGKTVYNTVEAIRHEYDIKKSQTNSQRIYEKRLEEPYGAEAQADFGSYNMITPDGNHKKVYFFVMVLSRSRYKYVFFQDQPFTSQTTIDAHNEAFNYFNGQPKRILYDQDRVLMKDENLGDLILVQQFQSYISTMKFRPIFCRKADPESKGKVENVVGYVKKNFLKGREYKDINTLNEAVCSWLKRTGNGTTHAGTKKIPAEEWQIEQNHLLAYYHQVKPVVELATYKVRKDNTISYKGNFYTLPLGTYKDTNSEVRIKTDGDMLYIFSDSKEQELLTTHDICYKKGKTIRNTDHRRDKSQSLEVLKQEVANVYNDIPSYKQYIDQIIKDKPRYVRDNLLKLKSGRDKMDSTTIEEAIVFCIKESTYNANTMLQVARSYQKYKESDNNIKPLVTQLVNSEASYKNLTTKRSEISTYEKMM